MTNAIIETSRDTERQAAFGRKARARVEQLYSAESYVTRLDEMYQRRANRKLPAPSAHKQYSQES